MEANMIIEEKYIWNKETLSSFFRKAGERLQEEVGEGLGKLYRQKQIAQRLDISVEQLRKKIYRKENDRLTRDWIIALCAAYGCDDAMTDEALIICGEPTIDDSSPREAFMSEYLRKHDLKPTNLSEFNCELLRFGLRPLDTGSKRSKGNMQKSSNDNSFLPYGEMKDIYESKGYLCDAKTSIKEKYIPSASCFASGTITLSDGTKRNIGVYSDGFCVIKDEVGSENEYWEEFVSYQDAGVYSAYCYELYTRARRNEQILNDIAYDTRNYKERFGIGIKNNSIHIFLEAYNYDIPGLNEYYFMEYLNGEYVMSVRNASIFMHEYLNGEQYLRYFGGLHSDISCNEHYNSTEQIQDGVNILLKISYGQQVVMSRERAYMTMRQKVMDILQDLRDRKLFAQTAADVKGVGNILYRYGLDEAFECKLPGEMAGLEEVFKDAFRGRDDFYPTLENISVDDGNGVTIKLELSEVIRAFELGFDNLQQILKVIKEKGGIEQVLYS